MLKYIPLLCMVLLSNYKINSQPTLTLEKAYEMAKKNYPLLKSMDIHKALLEKENDLVDQSRKPTIMLNGDASLQSEAISIGEEGSPVNVNVPIYRAQAYGEITYNIYNGGVSDVQKQINEINTIILDQQLEVNLYPLKEQVNRIFSGVNLGLELKEIFKLTEMDIEARRNLLKAGVENGITLESELTKLDVRLLELENEKLQVNADIRSAYSLLSVVIGGDIDPSTILKMPDYLPTAILLNVNRPEIQLFSDQKIALDIQKEMIDVMDKPNISVFGQAGISYPNNLNFSDVSLSPFALGGIKANYKLFNKKDKSIKKQKLDLQADLIDIQEETFTHNLNVQSAKYQDDFQLLSNQIVMYQKIAELQSSILSQLQVQLDNGVITSTEYLLQSTEELRARQNVKITQSKLEQKQLEYMTIYGSIN